MRGKLCFTFFLRKIPTFKTSDDQEESRGQPDGDSFEIVIIGHHVFSRPSFKKSVSDVLKKTINAKATNLSFMMVSVKRKAENFNL